MDDAHDGIEVPLVFVGLEDTSILFANHFAVQHQQDEFLLIVGQIAPPILIGDPEERRAQAQAVSYVPIKVVARFGLTRTRIQELIQVLQSNLDTHDRKR